MNIYLPSIPPSIEPEIANVLENLRQAITELARLSDEHAQTDAVAGRPEFPQDLDILTRLALAYGNTLQLYGKRVTFDLGMPPSINATQEYVMGQVPLPNMGTGSGGSGGGGTPTTITNNYTQAIYAGIWGTAGS